MNSMVLENNSSTEIASYNLIINILKAFENKFTVGADLLRPNKSIRLRKSYYFTFQIRILWHYGKRL